MKPCKEEKSGLDPGPWVLFDCILFLSLLFVISPGFLQAQIPVNGFCRFENYKTQEGVDNILSLNFNNDSYSDLLLFGSGRKSIVTSKGLENGRFSPSKSTKIPYEISSIKLFNSKTSSGNLYAFISRKARTVGILKVSTSGAISILNEKKLESYPDNLTVADINNDGKKEILVSGGAFEGVSAFYVDRKGFFEEKKIFDKRIFSQLVVTDLNHDSYPDIAAFDLLDNSIKFFYNNSIGDFYEVRRFKVEAKISSLVSYDFNLDNIQDLIYVINNKIYFLFGDYRSTFSSSLTVQFEKQIDDLAFGDFNHDGLMDIAYINKSSSVLSIAFSKEQNKFYPEIQYFSRIGLSKLIPFYSKYIHGLVALSTVGEYYMVSECNAVRDNLKISLGVSPSLISCFDAGNDAIVDLCYYDDSKPSLDLIVRNNDGIPSKFYSIPLKQKCSGLEIFDQNGKNKIFYCYSKGKKLIEIVSVNLRKNTFETEKIYSAEPIEDLKIKQFETGGKPLIYVLSRNNSSVRLFCYRYSNFRYTSTSSGKIASNVLQAKLVVDNPSVTIFFWKKEKRSIAFNKIFVNNDLNYQESAAKYVLPLKTKMEIFDFTGDIFNDNRNESLNFVFSNNSRFAIVSSGSSCYKLDLQGSLRELKLDLKGSVRSMVNRSSGLNDLFVFNSLSGSLEKFDLLSKQKILFGKKLVETIAPESYFVRSLSSDKYHMVYTDKAENCIKIKEIPL